MIKKRTSRYTSTRWQLPIKVLIACLLLLPADLMAQEVTDSVDVDAEEVEAEKVEAEKAATNDDGTPRPTKYIPTEEDMKQTFFQGFTVSADVLNMGLFFLSDYGNLEASLRLNLLNTYFPIVELGLGKCNKTDYNTQIHFSTKAPYLKIGVDYNLLRDKWQTNKLFFGLRYGITNFNYSFSGKDQIDPIWHTTGPLDVHGINATSHYLEVVFGCQVKIWSIVHMGWSARYKQELHTTKSIYSHPYYIPGYGTTVSGSYWGATYNISFDLNWGKKKPTIKQVVDNVATDINQQPAKSE